jgi:hypothetical protein
MVAANPPIETDHVHSLGILMIRLRRPLNALRLVIGFTAAAILETTPGLAQELLPDIVPWVREDAPYLVNWDISGSNLRLQTMFANIGDGLLQIRTDGAGTGGPTTPLNQRVFSGIDNGPIYQDYFVENVINFHQEHGHIHFENFSEFQLLEAVVDASGVVTVGDVVANTEKTSYRISDTNRIPDPQYAGRVSYPSSNTGLYQNISVGWGDVYSHGTEGQSISLAGVSLTPQYWLRQIVDPINVLREKDDTNNSFEILVELNRTPGQAVRHLDGSFVQPGDTLPLPLGDLTGDRAIDLLDWLAFKAAATADLTGVSDEMALRLGDLNLDRLHSLSDVRLFREAYEQAQGGGSFERMLNIPEPATWLLIGGLAAWLLCRRNLTALRVHRSPARLAFVACLALVAIDGREAAAKISIFYENFDGLTLGPNVHETVNFSQAWTDTPPAGWTVDDGGVPFLADSHRGVEEWEGWSFANKDWWSTAAGDQDRSLFTLGQGTVAVADPDEWEDRGNPINGAPFAGYYNALFKTPAVSLAGVAPGAAKLTFSSSWRDECCDDGPANSNDQTARIRVSYDNGASFSEVLRWQSAPASPFFKNDAPNETVVLDLNNPAGAQNVIVEFGLLNAGNDWWWAVDNVEVFTPTVLEVHTDTGEMRIVGAAAMTGYEIISGAGSLNGTGWRAGNLDSQNYGPAQSTTADFNNSNSVDAADYAVWRDSLALDDDGDANGDGLTNELDYAAWTTEFGRRIEDGQSWETLIASNSQLMEFFLLGNSTFASRTIGYGYNPAVGDQNLTFRYTLAGGLEFAGTVRYVSAGLGAAVVPEPVSGSMFMVGLVAVFASRRSIALLSCR